MIFTPPDRLAARTVSRVPDALRRQHPGWGVPHLGTDFDCYIEGVAFNSTGELHVIDIPSSRVLKMASDGAWSVVAEYDGRPKGLKFRPDGRMLVSDNRLGLVEIDPGTGAAEVVLTRSPHGHFQACNDLHISPNGDVIFTDQAASSLAEPNGCVFRWRTDGSVDRLINNAPGPNGLVFNLEETKVYVSIVRANAIWCLELDDKGRHQKTGLFIQLSGGIGPDGLAMDEAGGLIVAHLGSGMVHRFDSRGRLTHFIESPAGDLCSSVAFGTDDRRELFISEASGTILSAMMPYGGVAPPGRSKRDNFQRW